ncbi:signal peptidase I [Lentibacillus amyloliquefaciens]|uniref:Signal peptidase I n=1 Tax=Lentibacillus amyloliquefaciens TaxID=1472767 RepID=A0A0U4EZI7_9BACI|nr:signal peptidase I [Lentibacillus amyloliquefaciens]ALX48679.1 S26 family signal peptidase [Lentibacillus amyloliquefaciens]
MKRKRRYIKKIVPVVLVALVLAIIFRSSLFASYVVNGESMEPTLYDGNLLMVNKVAYNLTEVDRFDIIVFHADKQDDYVKRVIGLPGDEIIYENDKLYINGEHVEEPFLEPFRNVNDTGPYTEDFTLKGVTDSKEVPEGKLFVMGDNRQDSLDSREIGFIDAETLVGKVDIKYWPVSEVKLSFG